MAMNFEVKVSAQTDGAFLCLNQLENSSNNLSRAEIKIKMEECLGPVAQYANISYDDQDSLSSQKAEGQDPEKLRVRIDLKFDEACEQYRGSKDKKAFGKCMKDEVAKTTGHEIPESFIQSQLY